MRSSGKRPYAPRRAPITLDDTVSAIRSLELSKSERRKTVFTRDEINVMVQRAMLAGLKDLKGEISVPFLLSAAEKKTKSSSLLSSAASSRKESREPSVNPNKRPSQKFCFDCGQKDHVRGDSPFKSPSFYTKKVGSKASTRIRRTTVTMEME